jgi:transposase
MRDMLDALIAGERDPRRLADLARGRMRTKRTALVEAPRGRFDDHHAELVRDESGGRYARAVRH